MRSDANLIENLQSFVRDLAKQRKFRKFTQRKGLNLFKTQWFKNLSDKRKDSVIEALQRMRDGNYALLQDTMSKPLLDLLIGRSNRPPRSIAKRYVVKERDVIILVVKDRLKPKQISQRLKIPVVRVYRILRRFQQNISKVLHRGEPS
jgi:DNA-directed RNA polymerase specialized sigma24 family protein